MLLSDVGSWASIIGLILSFFIGFGICKITIKNNKQENKDSSFIKIGDTRQENVSNQ